MEMLCWPVPAAGRGGETDDKFVGTPQLKNQIVETHKFICCVSLGCSVETLLLVWDAIKGRSARGWFGFSAAHVVTCRPCPVCWGGTGCRCLRPLVHMLHDMIVWLACLFKSKPKICNCEVQERLQASLCSASLLNLFVFSSLCQR